MLPVHATPAPVLVTSRTIASTSAPPWRNRRLQHRPSDHSPALQSKIDDLTAHLNEIQRRYPSDQRSINRAKRRMRKGIAPTSSLRRESASRCKCYRSVAKAPPCSTPSQSLETNFNSVTSSPNSVDFSSEDSAIFRAVLEQLPPPPSERADAFCDPSLSSRWRSSLTRWRRLLPLVSMASAM